MTEQSSDEPGSDPRSLDRLRRDLRERHLPSLTGLVIRRESRPRGRVASRLILTLVAIALASEAELLALRIALHGSESGWLEKANLAAGSMANAREVTTWLEKNGFAVEVASPSGAATGGQIALLRGSKTLTAHFVRSRTTLVDVTFVFDGDGRLIRVE